jgi:hypothetical protein
MRVPAAMARSYDGKFSWHCRGSTDPFFFPDPLWFRPFFLAGPGFRVFRQPNTARDVELYTGLLEILARSVRLPSFWRERSLST